MFRLKFGKAPGQPETPIGEDGPTAWLVDEEGNPVFAGHVLVDGDYLTASSPPGSTVSSGLRFVGEQIK